MDEHRVGLKPVIRRIWVDEWTVPIANVNWRFEWLWLYGFVHPESGHTKGVDSTLCQLETVLSSAGRLCPAFWCWSRQTHSVSCRPSGMAYQRTSKDTTRDSFVVSACLFSRAIAIEAKIRTQ